MLGIFEPSQDTVVATDLDLRADDPTDAAPEIFDATDGWVSDRLS